jgi:hypothetical protein
MTQADIAARVERLTKLSAGFGKEIELLRKQRLDPSLHRDVRDYFAAIQAAQDAVDRAWMTLLKLKQRLAKLHGAG